MARFQIAPNMESNQSLLNGRPRRIAFKERCRSFLDFGKWATYLVREVLECRVSMARDKYLLDSPLTLHFSVYLPNSCTIFSLVDHSRALHIAFLLLPDELRFTQQNRLSPTVSVSCSATVDVLKVHVGGPLTIRHPQQ